MFFKHLLSNVDVDMFPCHTTYLHSDILDNLPSSICITT